MVKDIPHEPSPWERGVARLLGQVTARTRLLGAVAPDNGSEERERLTAALERGDAEVPRWSYARAADSEAAAGVETVLREAIAFLGDWEEPLARAYAERAEELLLEVRLTRAVGRADFGDLARERFVAEGAEARDALSLAETWLGEEPPAESRAEPSLTSDSDDPRGLVARLREEIARLRAPFDVRVHTGLVSLAATGERTVWVARGRPTSQADVERTVVHEVFGHVLPRVRAAALSCPLFRLGTRRGTDEQEGLALMLEARHGVLDPLRKRELALRHRAVTAMDAGASFAETSKLLVKDHGLTPRRAIGMAERVYRGGCAGGPGLGRERVYLPSFLRVSALVEEAPWSLRVLASGQVATEFVPLLGPLLARALAEH